MGRGSSNGGRGEGGEKGTIKRTEMCSIHVPTHDECDHYVLQTGTNENKTHFRKLKMNFFSGTVLLS